MISLFEKFKINQNKEHPATRVEWLYELDSADDLTAIEKATSVLSKVHGDTTIPDNNRLEIIFKIDEYLIDRVVKVTQQYIKFDNLRLELESRMFDAVYYYYRQTYLNYLKQIEYFIKTPEVLRKDYQDFTLTLARAINASFAMIRLRYYVHHSAPNAAWTQIHQLFKVAEKEDLLHIPIKLYRTSESIKIDSFYVHGCLLDSVNFSGKNRQLIDLSYQLVKRLFPEVTTTAQFQAKKHYLFVDLAKDEGARRLEESALTTTCRFWDMDQLSIKLDLLVYTIKNNKSLENLSLEDLASNPLLINASTLIQTAWSKTQQNKQRRREQRKPSSRIAMVSYGMDGISGQIKFIYGRGKGGAYGKSLEERLSSHSVNNNYSTSSTYGAGERWIISDESPRGLGAEALKDTSLAVKPDKLVGLLFTDHDNQYVLGVVRSVIDNAQNKRKIGIELLSKQVSWIQVRKINQQFEISKNPPTISEDVIGFTGLYLAKEEALSEMSSVVVPRINFVENEIYEISNTNTKMVVRLGKIIEARDDWARVTVASKLQ